ncbi:phage tail length tape measure family protein [Serratia fonticola]|uniref:phage tail length tape measure family protein n=1 Tax=Serratia fonticola TaxID=47917 RepID=UPI003AAD5FA7
MTEQTSRLAIVIDSTGAEKQADSLSTALDKMTGSGKEASKAVSDTGKAADSAAKSVTRKARATEDESNALNALLAKIRPTNTALAELDKLSGRLTTAFNKGFINESQFVTYDTILAGLVMKMEKVDDELTGVAAAQREVAKTEKEAAVQAEAQSRALSQLEARLAPVTAALKGLDDQQRQVAEFAKSGAISAEQYATYIAKLTEARREVTGEAQAERDAAKAAQEHAAAVSKLGSSLDPVTASLKRLDEQQKQVNANLKSGDISASQYDTYTQAISRARAEVNGEAQAERDAAKARQEHIASLSKLESSLDPVTAALKRLDDQQRQVNANFKAGDLTSAQYDTYNRSISTARAELNGEAQAARDSAKAHDEQKASLERLIAQLDPASEALKRLDAQQQQLAQAKAKGLLDADTYDSLSMRLVTMREEMDKARVQMDKGAISAGQYKQAMRQLPAQFTDIFTSIAGGMPLWLIFTQQGGQIADSFGGWSSLLDVIKREVLGFSDATEESSDSLSDNANGLAENADHLKQFSGLLTPTRLALGGVAAAVGLLTYAYYQGSKEQDAFNESLILTGNIVGKTSGQLAYMATAIADNAGSTVAMSSDVLNQLVAGGKVAVSTLSSASEAIIKLNDATGISTSQLVSDFEAIAGSPVEAIGKLNDQYHFLTLATYNQIRALQEEGNQQEAAKVASDAYSTAISQKADDIKASLGTLQTAWNDLADAAKGAWDKMLDIGRESSLEQRLGTLEETLADAKAKQKEGGLWNRFSANASGYNIQEMEKQVAALKSQITAQNVLNDSISSFNQRQQKAIEAQKYVNSLAERTKTNAQKRAQEQAALTRKISEGAILSAEEEARIRKNIDEKYKDPKTPKGKAYTEDAATRLLDQLNQQSSALQNQFETTDKIGAAQQSLIKWEQQLADIKSKKTLTADQKSLLANQDSITAKYQENAALEKQVALRKELEKLTAFKNTLSSGLQNDAASLQNSLNSNTVLSKEQKRQQELTKISTDFQKKQTELANQRTTGQISGDLYNQETDALQAALNQRLALQQAYYTQLDQLNGNWQMGVQNGLQSYMNSVPSLYESVTTATTSILGATESAISSNLSAMLQGTESLSDGFKNMATGMGQAVIDALTKMAAQWLVYQAVQLVVGKTAAAGASASMIGQATAMSQIAAINAYASAAAIPITGWAMAPAAMGAALAATTPLIASIAASSAAMTAGAGFMSGGYTGNMATNAVAGVVHGKEFVFDAAATKKIGVSNLEALRNGKPLDATLGKSGFGTGAQNVSNSSQKTVNNFTANLPPVTINGNPSDATIQLVQQAAKTGAEQGYKRIVNDIATGRGEAHKALVGGYNTSRRTG